MDGDGVFNFNDIAEQLKAYKNNEWMPLDGDGDFRSQECIELLEQSDVVVTNPPFSLFREYIKQGSCDVQRMTLNCDKINEKQILQTVTTQ